MEQQQQHSVETCTGGGWRPGETQPSCPLHPPVFDLGECLGLSGVDKGLRFNLALVQVSFRTHPDFVSLFRKNPPNNFWAVTTCARPHHNSTKFFESFEWRKSVNSESLAAHMLNTYLLYLDLGRIQCISLYLEQEPPPTTLLSTLGITQESLGSEKIEGKRGLLRLSLMAPCEAPCM